MTEEVCAEIQVRKYEFQQIDDPSYLKVDTYPTPTNPAIRLAHIKWFKKGSVEVTCKRLVTGQPMSHEDAMAVANLLAEKNEVPMIYERMHGPTH